MKYILQNITGSFNWLNMKNIIARIIRLDRNTYRRLIPALVIAVLALSFLSAAPAEAG